MTSANFHRSISALSVQALEHSHRQIVILQGGVEWANKLLYSLPSNPFNSSNLDKASKNLSNTVESWYIFSDDIAINGNVNKQTFRNKLGTESQFVVFYSKELNIDALAALSGTLTAGGILFIVLPENIENSEFYLNSLFNQRLVNKIFNSSDIEIIKEQEEAYIQQSPPHSDVIAKGALNNDFLAKGCLTQEQLSAVEHVIQVVKGHRNRPLVLTADRGRGKSSALAIACAELLESAQSTLNIVITATHRKSLNVFFSQISNTLKIETDNTNKSNIFEHKNGSVQFMPVDELIKTKSTFNLVLVDEAASIPLYLLNQLSAKYHRMVFASTVHGYEGAGRSFTLKFQKALMQKYPECKRFNISQPIRWANDDPLEAFIYDLGLLNADIPPLSPSFVLPQLSDSSNNVFSLFEFTEVTAKELMKNEALLQQVFAVLVTAHYQTSPNDLRLLLDNNNITLVTLSYQKQLLGVALLLKEGLNKADELKALVQSNQRRLKDQFIPQSLLTHCGEEDSFSYAYLRVMRIAVLPELQQQGLGQIFLTNIDRYAKKLNIDFVGTSFGANKALLNFWQKQGYKIARIGFTKDKASGEHSALLIKPINQQHKHFVEKIEGNFYQSFDYLLAEQYKNLLPELVWQIMHYCPPSSLPTLNDIDLKTVEDFYTKKRQYSVCVYQLHRWLQHQMKMPFDIQMAPLISKVFQRKDVATLTETYGFTGKKAFNDHLIQFIQSYSQKQFK